ncbi:hypothetical protein T492DRAFT_1013140 [Pavlovales sp. CCMP2436]|nr:hypothetical protein T492DRAFT_1013140 [Pavlovales sp. CCMP2436]
MSSPGEGSGLKGFALRLHAKRESGASRDQSISPLRRSLQSATSDWSDTPALATLAGGAPLGSDRFVSMIAWTEAQLQSAKTTHAEQQREVVALRLLLHRRDGELAELRGELEAFADELESRRFAAGEADELRGELRQAREEAADLRRQQRISTLREAATQDEVDQQCSTGGAHSRT